MDADFRDAIVPPGTKCLFEYHCNESPQSSDAALWYRSHQVVTVLECTNPEFYEPGATIQHRIEVDGTPLAYRVVFCDGFECTSMEDELLLSEAEYERDDPPTPPVESNRREFHLESKDVAVVAVDNGKRPVRARDACPVLQARESERESSSPAPWPVLDLQLEEDAKGNG